MRKYKEYDVEDYDGDIILYKNENDALIIEGGFTDLESEAIYSVGHYRPDSFREEDGETLEYDNDDVEAYIESHYEQFIEKNFTKAKVLEP